MLTKIWEVVSGVLGKIWEKIQFVWEPIKSGLNNWRVILWNVEKQAKKLARYDDSLRQGLNRTWMCL